MMIIVLVVIPSYEDRKTECFLSVSDLQAIVNNNMTTAKDGFHWKTIEEKPENWEKMHILIQSSYTEKKDVHDKAWEKGEVITAVVAELYPDLKLLLPTRDAATAGKKKTQSKKHEIQSRVERENVRKDILNIRFDKDLRPLTLHFGMEPTFVVMIFVWNYLIDKKRNPEPMLFLDGLISLNRIMTREEENIRRIAPLWEAMTRLRERMNRSVTEETYALLFQNPILLVEATADKRAKSIRLYPEQEKILETIVEAIVLDEPLLMGNQMPTGTGKTFLAVPLAQKLGRMKRRKTVLFACSNELVNTDIASTALLGDDIHLWMSSLIRGDKGEAQVLLRPYKRCFPNKWKDVYKTDSAAKTGSIAAQWEFYTKETGKNPDIVVADLEACYELLKASPLIDDPFVAYIDEFVSDTASNDLMGKICRYLPRHTVLLSAILPRFDVLDPIVQDFARRHGSAPLQRIEAAHVPITCAIIDHEGRICMPHHALDSPEQTSQLVREFESNPRIRRCYTAKHVYHWAKDLEDILPLELRFVRAFPDIGSIKNEPITAYVGRLLGFLVDHPEHFARFRRYRPVVMEPVDRSKILKEHAASFDGKTLYISTATFENLERATEGLFEDVRFSTIFSARKKEDMSRRQRLENLEKMKNARGSGFNSLERDRMIAGIQEDANTIQLPARYVPNSLLHYRRYHDDQQPAGFSVRSPIYLPDAYHDAFSDQENLLLSAGVGFYDKTRMTSYQRNLVMAVYRELFMIFSCKDIVFGTNLPGLVNVYIGGDFAAAESVPTLYQLMGRVGRMGRSYHANIILDSAASVQKVLSLDCNVEDTEVYRLLDSFRS